MVSKKSGAIRLFPEEALLIDQYNLGLGRLFDSAKGAELKISEIERISKKRMQIIANIEKKKRFDITLTGSMHGKIENYRLADATAEGLEDSEYSVLSLIGVGASDRWSKSDFNDLGLRKGRLIYSLFPDTITPGTVREMTAAQLIYQKPVVAFFQNLKEYDKMHNIHPASIVGGVGFHIANEFKTALQCIEDELSGKLKTYEEVTASRTNEICENCKSVLRRYG